MNSGMESDRKNEYPVSPETRKLWAVDLDLLSELERVCEKYGLRYYADGGTLLGAVRHHGFIPWDDDIDIQMMYEDYQILCSVAAEEFREPYFFQYYGTEPGFWPWQAKLRRSDTTGCSTYEFRERPLWNHGIFIDIFPLFAVPDNRLSFGVQIVRLKILSAVMHFYYCLYKKYAGREEQKDAHANSLGEKIWFFLTDHAFYDKLCRRYLNICSQGKNDSKRIGVTAFKPGKKNLIWQRTMYDGTVELPFEDRVLKCPSQYDARLRIQYGDYTVEKKGTQLHSQLIVEPEIPYRVYQSTSNETGGNI